MNMIIFKTIIPIYLKHHLLMFKYFNILWNSKNVTISNVINSQFLKTSKKTFSLYWPTQI